MCLCAWNYILYYCRGRFQWVKLRSLLGGVLLLCLSVNVGFLGQKTLKTFIANMVKDMTIRSKHFKNDVQDFLLIRFLSGWIIYDI